MGRKSVWILVAFALLMCSSNGAKSQNKLFVYYPTWGAYVMPPSDLKFPQGIETIYMHFSAHASGTAPYFSPVVSGNTDSADLAYLQRALIDTCHRAGQKVLLSITAQDNTMGDIAGNTTQRKAFVSSVCSYLKRKGYDGVDLDWEINLSAANVAAMVKEFRDTLNTWSTPGMLVMSVLTDPFTYSSWNFYNTGAMNQYLDAYFTMSYGMHGVERQADALGGEAGGVWRCMFDAPYVRPTGTPWSGYAGGYWAANFKENSIAKWMARGADTAKVGIGIWNGGTTMLNSSSSSTPGSVISYGTASFPTYPQVLGGTSNYNAETDHYWGIVGGKYTSWIDSAGTYKRTKWAKDTMHTKIFMLYDAYSGFIDGPARYGRQPHFDAMVNAIRSTQAPTPTGSFSATPNSLPSGGGNVTLAWTSSNAQSASIDQGVGSVQLNGSVSVAVTSTRTFQLTLTNANGTQVYPVTVTVAAAPTPTGSLAASTTSLPVGGGSVTLTWTSLNATNASLDQGIGPVSLNGNTTIAVSQTTTYTLTLTNASGSRTYAVQVVVALPTTTTTKIMLLGDSITELDWQAGYRSQLYHLLQLGGYNFDFVGRSTTNHDEGNLGFAFPTAYWDHEGYSNATIDVSSTYTWKNYLRTALTAGRPDVVCVMLGTNDVFSTIRNATQVRDAMSAFLDSIWAFNPGIKVVLSTMPRVFGYPTALPIIQSANALWPAMVGAKQSGGRSIALVDNFAALTLSTDFVDGVHPSIGGYVKMANAWLPAVAAALSSTTQPTGTFTALPLSLPVGGGNVTLSWTSNGATTATIDQGIGSVALNGTRVVSVPATKTFTITLANASGGTVSYQVTITVGTPPPVPVLASPANGATNQPTSITLSWNAANGATSYRLQVSTDSLFANRIVDDSTIATISRQVVGLGNQTKYYWRLRSQSASGYSAYCQARSFTTISTTLPSGTFSVAPDTLPVGGGTATLTWSSSSATTASIDQGIGSVGLSGSRSVTVSATTLYTLTLTNSSGSRTYQTTLSVRNAPPPPSAAVPVYQNNALTGPWNDIRSWSVACTYNNPTPVFEGSSSLRGVHSAWGSLQFSQGSWGSFVSIDPAQYQSFDFAIHGGTSGAVVSVRFLGPSGAALMPAVQVTAPANAWLFRSIPIGQLANAPFISIEFSAGAASATFYLDNIVFEPVRSAFPVLVFPISGAIDLPVSLGLRWNRVSGATMYHVQVATDSGFTSVVVNDSVVTDTSRQVSALLYQTKYYWRVRSKNSGGYGQYSQPRSFATVAVPLPTGTLAVAPDTLPQGGGSVTLSWTSNNAAVASLDQGIGTVALSGSRVAIVGQTTTFSLTLTNSSGTRVYTARVGVALPSGQGPQDITSQGVPIALITSPTGGGNLDIEVIRDGNTPPLGSTNVLDQYDTFTGVSGRTFEWIGYQFSATRVFTRLLFQEGLDNQWGGCFETLRVQIRVSGVWRDVDNLVSVPQYPGSNFINFETFDLGFSPVAGDAIRIAGPPTGSARYIGVGELRAFGQSAGPLPAAPQLVFPSNGATGQPAVLTLRWNRVGSVSGYHVQVSVDSLFSSTFADDAQLTDTVRQVSGLSSLTNYFWRVSSRSPGGEGAYSGVWRFTTLSGLPGTPILTSPLNNATNLSLTPTLRWSLASGAVSYHVQVSRDSLFSTTILNDSTLVNRSRQISGLTNLTKYFWRVRAKNAAGYGSFSTRWSFTTKKSRTNVTADATLISLIAQPTGQGNPNREVIRDGVTPPLGYTNPLDQFDTFTGSTRQTDWIGYTFTTHHRFSNLEFQEGIESDSGGWFASLNVQVRVGGNWVDVQNLVTIPPYVPNNGESYESYELGFDPVVGDGIRIVGTPGGTYTYISVAELQAMDDDLSLTGVSGTQQIPNKYVLDQNYPNPFNPSTKISFVMPAEGFVSLTVFDLLGRKVASLVDGVMQSGKHTVEFSGNNFADGVYMYILKSGNFSDMKKMILLK